jgi:hypothetical protein
VLILQQCALGDTGLHPKIEDLSESIDHSVLSPVAKSEGDAPQKRVY